MSVSCCGGPRFSGASQNQKTQQQQSQVNFGSAPSSSTKTTAQPKFGCLAEGGAVALGCCAILALVCGIPAMMIFGVTKGFGALKDMVSNVFSSEPKEDSKKTAQTAEKTSSTTETATA